MYKSVQAGVSEQISFANLNTNELRSKLENVLYNPSFKNKMAIRSRLLRDQPEKPIDRAVWWVEYILRNPDASHLRTPTIELGFLRSNSLDMYALLYTGFILVIIALFFLIRTLWKKCYGSDKKMKEKLA